MLHTIQRLALAFAVAAGSAAVPALPAAAAPEADLWPRWQAHDADATATIDHSAWSAFLDRYLVVRGDGANLVRYAGVSDADRRRLDGYLDRMAGIEISDYSRPVQFAYWVNLYNALTVEVVLDHYPVDSIRDIDISPGWFASGPWGAELITVESTALSLNDIEHRILRPIWQDPRIHYAVNCASIGCPDLRPDPYTADRLDAQLDAAARAYVNDPRGARVVDGALTVSKIYTWYQEDFENSDAGVIRHLQQYADADLQAALDAVSTIDDSRYDWSLNDAPPGGS